jgi:hypothetical protein
MGRMRGIVEEPTGLRYIPSLLSEDQERDLLERLRGMQLDEVRMHGQVARRVVRHFGVQHAFESAAITPGPPIRDWLTDVRDFAAHLLDVSPAALAEVLVTYYPPVPPSGGIGTLRSLETWSAYRSGRHARCDFSAARATGAVCSSNAWSHARPTYYPGQRGTGGSTAFRK